MVNRTYPDVYVQPVITPPPTTGVATSVTVFVGRTPRGPVNEPMSIASIADYEIQFDGLDLNSTTSYMVSDFYENGGEQGAVVRLFEPHFETPADLQHARGVARQLSSAGESKTISAQDSLAAVTAAISKAKYTGADAETAQRFVASYTVFVSQDPESKDATAMKAALGGALRAAAPQGKATIQMSLVNTVANAAAEVAQASVIASRGSPSRASTVVSAMKATSAQYTVDQSKSAVAAVIKAAEGVNATSANAGMLAAYTGAFEVPDAVDKALNIKKNGDQDAYKAYSSMANKVKSLQIQSLSQSATNDTILALAKSQLREMYDALETAANNGATPHDLGLKATELLTAMLLEAWPNIFILDAANEGTWGNCLVVRSDQTGITSEMATQISPSLTKKDLFNLTVTYTKPDGTTMSERFQNVTVNLNGGSQRLDKVLKQQSMLLRVPTNSEGTKPVLPVNPPDANASGTGSGGTDSMELSLNTYLGDAAAKTGLYALDKMTAFNILSIPPDVRQSYTGRFGDTPKFVYQTAAEYCSTRRAILIMDPPNAWGDAYKTGQLSHVSLDSLGSFSAMAGRSAAVYFPRIVAVDPNENGHSVIFPASGALAGIWATTDAQSGVWKAPAGLNAAFNGIVGPEFVINDASNGMLNSIGINCLREFEVGGTVVWGARTLRGADQLADEYKYIPVMRTSLYVENSLLQSTQWAVFEENNETLWARLRLQVGTFMASLFKQGALGGTSADQAYFVKCDATTTTPADQASGRVNVQVGFLPVYPAEFVVITIGQITQKTTT